MISYVCNFVVILCVICMYICTYVLILCNDNIMILAIYVHACWLAGFTYYILIRDDCGSDSRLTAFFDLCIKRK